MNLYYDNIVYDLQNFGGISTYWYELTERSLNNSGVNMRFYQTDLKNNNVLRKNLILTTHQIAVSRRRSKLIERFRTLHDWEFEKDSVFHSSYFRVPDKDSKVKIVSTIHDFTHDLFFKGPRVWMHNFAKRRSIHRSDAIITVSENTKKDLLRFYPEVPEEKIHVIYNGVSDKFQPLDEAASPTMSLLYVGARDTYKNFKFAVDLAKGQVDATLNIVGSPLSAMEKMDLDSALPGRYQVHTHISTEQLNVLYNQAACLLYPSSYEGFGIPLLEAMRAGCPFLALNCSSIPEVAGDAGYLLNNLDLEEGQSALNKIINNRALFASKGFTQSLKFSWDKCYDETYKLYSSLI
jgi:mannosyltransferase